MMELNERISKNDSFRKLEISDYRNIGLFKEKAIMTLNHSLEKDNLGGLVILVGPNNSGKSNVLDALHCIGNGGINEKDYCDFYYDLNVKPKIKMVVKDQNDYYDIEMNPVEQKKEIIYNDFDEPRPPLKKLKKQLQDLEFQQMTSILTKEKEKALIDLMQGLVIQIDEREKNMNQIDFQEIWESQDESSKVILGIPVLPKVSALPKVNGNAQKFKEKFNYNLTPKIISYENDIIHQHSLKCKYDEVNNFIKSIMKILGKDPEGLVHIYTLSKERRQSSILSKFEEELNKDLYTVVTSKFNKMYILNNEEYIFKFKLNDETINFEIYRGSTPLNLDFQSTGFRWFFEFFFNFVCNNELQWGDIVIMDEPATNLHVSGQMELRKFLKEFAKSSGLTFIISTHSPFLIDCDHLEEVRLMQMNVNGSVIIRDKFSGLPDDTLEQTNEVFKALTVGRHMMMDPSSRLYFVEGITDYNYLTAFKKLLGVSNVCFLPINGLKQDDFIPRLMKLDKEPVLIVDGDGAGKDLISRTKDTGVKVISLSEVKPSFRNIEDLFTKEDREKFNVADKSFNKTSVFKNSIFDIAEELSPSTKKNFEELLKYLEAA